MFTNYFRKQSHFAISVTILEVAHMFIFYGIVAILYER